ncbi:MAG: sulfotransferase domain-containing protein [Candidatus Thorarchaeota archaeon]
MTSNYNKKIDFIGIGAAKSATSWIYQCLIEHPEICGSSKKEIHYFDRIQNYQKGINYYLSFFKHCPKKSIKGEFTPGYIFNLYIPKIIHKHFPDIKIIACLRDPTDRLHSLYKYHVNMGYKYSIYKSFESVIEKEPEFVKTGFYYRQLREYYKIFPKENILILIYEDLLREPKENLKKIYKFLNLKEVDFVPPSIEKKLNITGTKIMKNKIPLIRIIKFKVNKYLESFQSTKIFLRRIKFDKIVNKFMILNSYQIKVDSNKKSQTLQNLKEDVRKYLKRVYREDIEKLEVLINRDLSQWK